MGNKYLVDRAEVADVLVAADLHVVHEHELPCEEAAQVGHGSALGDVEGSLVPEGVGDDDLLAEDTGNAEHGPAGVHELSLAVPGKTRAGSVT